MFNIKASLIGESLSAIKLNYKTSTKGSVIESKQCFFSDKCKVWLFSILPTASLLVYFPVLLPEFSNFPVV